jgi:hypothetical protein
MGAADKQKESPPPSRRLSEARRGEAGHARQHLGWAEFRAGQGASLKVRILFEAAFLVA